MELCDKSTAELARMLKKGDVSSREITESVFMRINEREETVNAFITITRETAFKQAAIADQRIRSREPVSMLNGIPVAFKDILCTKDIRTTCGSHILRDFVPTYNATAVEKILREGAVLIGKTNMDEFGMGCLLYTSPSPRD